VVWIAKFTLAFLLWPLACANPARAWFAEGHDENAFVSKLNQSGSALVYSTYLGGSNDDHGFGVAVDPAGNAYVTGRTASSDFPTTAGAFQTTFGGDGFDAFVSKLNSSGSALMYSTYLGGSDDDEGFAVAVNGGDAF